LRPPCAGPIASMVGYGTLFVRGCTYEIGQIDFTLARNL
jgi:hypothetical protein